jgi:uncharacterized membrane protein HdeD (DUF308 family)
MTHSHITEREPERPLPPLLVNLAEHWGLVLAYGIVTLGMGVALLVWPDVTITIFTVLVAIQLLVMGALRLVAAVSGRTEGIRVLVGLTGGIALVVGLLILRDPLQTVLVLAMVLGVFWLISGVVDVLGALVSPGLAGRSFELTTGVLSILFGGFLVVFTDFSLKVLVLLVALWLLVAGALALFAALRLRSLRPAA